MKTKIFLRRLSTFTFLPEGKRARARAIADKLSDKQREELIGELREANQELKEIQQEEQELSDEAEFLASDFEKLIKKTKRTMEEEGDEKEDLESIEEQLSTENT